MNKTIFWITISSFDIMISSTMKLQNTPKSFDKFSGLNYVINADIISYCISPLLVYLHNSEFMWIDNA